MQWDVADSLVPNMKPTILQVAEQLGASCQQLTELLPQGLQAAAAAAPRLHLQQRACHVFAEAQRVLAFKQICQDPQLAAGAKLQQLGDLLNASHISCAELYQCSCEELDNLVATARTAGALGARLTGKACRGGCGIMHAAAAMHVDVVHHCLSTKGRWSGGLCLRPFLVLRPSGCSMQGRTFSTVTLFG